MIDFTYSHLLLGIGVLIIVLIFLRKQKRSIWYLFFFSTFWIYLLIIVSVIVFPIPPFVGDYAGPLKLRVNLIPFYFGSCDFLPRLCLINILGNILLTVPLGFGISFIAHLKSKDMLGLALLVGGAFEATQLLISVVFRSAFRTIDINDVILNAAGVLLGYGIFRIFGRLYLFITQRFEINNKHIFAYVYDVFRQS